MILLLIILLVNSCYAYINNWFPVISLSSTDFSNPQSIRILGKDFVLWKKNELYIIQNNECPHRCAPLSEGYFDTNTKNLHCSYHGWEFNENGKCKNIPQLSERDMLGNIKMTLDKRKHVKTYSTFEYNDLLWVYLGNDTYNHTPNEIYNLQENQTVYMRELPYGLHILLENFFDPAHIPFAHHKLQSTRSKASPIKSKMISNNNNYNHLSIEFNEENLAKNISRTGFINFFMPCYYLLTQSKPTNSVLNKLHVFTVPIEEDKTRIFITYHLNKTHPSYKIYSMLPTWLKHSFTNKFLDSDTLLLHKQEQYLKLNNESYHDHKNYYLPTLSDKSVSIYKKWIKRALPTIPFFLNRHHKKELSRKEIFDRYEQHVKHCKHCSRALKRGRQFKHIGTFILVFCASYFRNSFLLTMASFNYFLFNKFEKLFYYNNYIHNEI